MKNILLLLTLLCLVSCVSKKSITTSDDPSEKPYVILISLDGYRYDYIDRFTPNHMTKLVNEGVRATSLIPCYPSKTFPNHYSIATGMYPENHGLVGNSFYDPEKDGIYRIRDREKVRDGSWYNGTPLWVHAENNGITSASYFFVGSDANIQNTYPTYYKVYDGKIPNNERTRQVINWLKLPETQRPRFITMYFSDIDNTGHRFGPNNDKELSTSIVKLDNVLGAFFDELNKLKLPINVIIVSDHGMMEIPLEHNIPIEKFYDDQNYLTVNNGTYFHVYPKRSSMDLDSLKASFEAKSPNVTAYKTTESPYYSKNQSNPRLGDMIVLADSSYHFTNLQRINAAKKSKRYVSGQHGFPTHFKDMHGVFYAFGSNIKKGKTIPSFKNIHIYPFICELLGLPIPSNIDGDVKILKHIVK